MDARQQFLRVEGLVDVIVGALLQRDGALGGLPHLCEEDGRRPDLGLAHATQGFAPVDARHEHVHHNHIRVMRLHLAQGFFAVSGDEHVKARALQKRGEAFHDHRVIVYEEEGDLVGHRVRGLYLGEDKQERKSGKENCVDKFGLQQTQFPGAGNRFGAPLNL